MPEKRVVERARKDAREGKAPSTQAGEFVREEIEHIRVGRHGAQSTKQAIAIGLSKARRAGVKLPPPEPGTTPASTQRKAARELARSRTVPPPPSFRKRARVTTRVLSRKSRSVASSEALSRQAKSASRRRSAKARSAAARKAARTRRTRQRAGGPRKSRRPRSRKA